MHIYKHALRNALIPTVTILGTGFGQILVGTVLLEITFLWPGLGRYAVDSILSVDFNAVIGTTLVIGVIFIVANFVVDLVYGLLDPRIRYD
jgi:peptide/nickel transport system permease protein